MDQNVLLQKYIYRQSKKARAYLRACHKNKQHVAQRPAFWADMYADDKLQEEG